MSRSQQTGTGNSWQHPLGLHPANADRWTRFCAEIGDRIRRVREEEGRDPWQTFGTDMTDFAEPTALPIGRVTYCGPALRDAYGRYRRTA